MNIVNNLIKTLVLFTPILLTGCSEPASNQPKAEPKITERTVSTEDILRDSMRAKNHVGLERLTQTELQQACSNASDTPNNASTTEKLRKHAEASVQYPADGNYLGNWQKGQTIADNGKGMQWTDDPSKPNGGNCYACHQLDKSQVAYGTIGPSLTNYGQRGQSEAILRYTWAKLWNPNVYIVCSHMPRFGDAGILTSEQIKDVMAFLLDPNSPVNRE